MKRVSAILPAAGLSRRMGQPKQLLPLSGKPLIRWCMDSLLAAGIKDIVVVLGRHRPAIEPVIDGLPVIIACNEDPESDMAGSVRIGLQAASPVSTGVLVALCDHPLVTGHTIRTLITCLSDNPDRIAIPVYRGRRGHPVIFPRAEIDRIFTGMTLRDIVRRDPGRIMPVDVTDEGVVIDIDTGDDYRALLSACAQAIRKQGQTPENRDY